MLRLPLKRAAKSLLETGTGKTYVYLRTVFELSRRYGFQKFVIVVPSVAIREGVLKNIEITAGSTAEYGDGHEYEYGGGFD